jgi:WD40 repeat protein
VSSAHFSLDGQWLATRSSDGTVKISATSSGQVRFTIDNHRGIEINAFALSPDATRLATSSRKDQKTQTVTVLDCGTDVKILDKPVPGGLITALTFSPDGKRLVTLAREQPNDDNVRVWDMESGDSSLANGHYDTVAFSPHGNLLAGAGQDRLVHLWTISNAGDVKPLRTLFGQSAPVLNVIFSPTSSRIAAASADGTARIWDVQSGRDLLSIRSAAKVAFGADGTHLASAGRDGPVSIWDIDSRAAAAASRVALSPDGDLLATSGSDEAVRIWHWDSRHPSHTLGSKLGSMYNLAFSPDGSRFVTVNTAGQATIWNLKDFHTERSFSVHPKDWVTLAWLDEKTIVTADASGTAEVRDPTNDNPPSVFGTPREVAASALSADGRHLAVVSLNHDKVEIWEDGRKDPSWSIPAGGVKFRDIALSPNGQYIAAISETGRMQLWDLTSNKLLTLPAADLGDEGLTAQSGLAFSPDGTHLATAHAEAVELWDFANKSNPEFIDTESVNILAFSRDGRRLATASRDGTFQVWPLDLEDRITLARALTTRSVKEEECKRYHVEPCPKSR